MSFRYEKAVELLDRAAENRRLAHAYLLIGPPGSGKEKLAVHMITQANGSNDMLFGEPSLQDLKSSTTAVIGPESKSRRITVDAVRALEKTLQMAAPSGITKFAVIKDADCMGAEAENAFLKTLEEPPSSSRLLLLTSRPEMLLDTILSRCIRIVLAGDKNGVALDENAKAFLDALKGHALSSRGGISGALGLMSKFAAILKEEKAEISKRNELAMKEEIAHYRNTTEGDYLKQRENYYKALTEAEYLQQRNIFIDYLMMWFGDAMRLQNGGQHLDLPDYREATERLASALSTDELGTRIRAVEDLRQNLSTNAMEALALEVGFLRAFS